MNFRDRWPSLSPLLDEVLDLDPAHRAEWLAALRARDADAADAIGALLEDQRALEDDTFLRGSVVSTSARAPAAGDVLGPYTLTSPIGEGGMGAVWLAVRSDGRFDRPAAVKFLSASLAHRGRARFRREGAILARLAHPHIAQLFDAGVSADGQPYLVLEYVDGQPIDAYCAARGLDLDERVRLLIDVVSAVAYAHASLVVHRDIKPSNVFVRGDGVVKLLDFGIAKLLDEEGIAGAALTRDAGAALTPEYAAPEQVTGEPVTAATDVYALAVLAYVLITGGHPTSTPGQSTASILKAIVDMEPRRASERTPGGLGARLRGDLDTILAKALKKLPAERYSTAAELGADLQRYLRHEPVHARPDTLSYRVRKFARRNRVAVSLGTAAALALAVGIAGTLVEASATRAERDYAVQQLARAEAINDLNNFVLYDAAPDGKTFTTADLLRDAEHIVRREPSDDVNRVAILVQIGLQYLHGDRDARAHTVLQDAYTQSLRLADSGVRARAACTFASALSRESGGQARAEALYQEAMRELPASGERFVLDRIFCLQRGSEVARESGRSREGVERAAEAERLLPLAPFQSDVMVLRAQTALAEALRVDGRQREAAAAFERAAARLAALGRDDTQNAGTLLNNWGVTLNQLGRTEESEHVLRRAIEISRDTHGEAAVSPMLLANYARTLRDLGKLGAAADYVERAYAKGWADGDNVIVNQALLLRGSVYREQGDLARAKAMFDEVEPRLREHLPPTHIAFASLASERALLAQDAGHLDEAKGLVDKALAMTEASIAAGGQGSDYLPTILTRRAGIEIEMGRADAARSDAQRAVSILEAGIEPGKPSVFLDRARAVLARAREATQVSARR